MIGQSFEDPLLSAECDVARLRADIDELRAERDRLFQELVLARRAIERVRVGVPHSGVPVPPSNRFRRGWTDAMRNLAVGDCVLLPLRDAAHAGSLWRNLKPQQYTSRVVPGGVRIWRTA